VIRRRTPKRARQEVEYKAICDEIDAEAKANGTFFCVFCGINIKGRAFHHHSRGRDGDLITEKKWIWLAHFGCHQDYHSLPVAKQVWRPFFLSWLKVNDTEIYKKELEKAYK